MWSVKGAAFNNIDFASLEQAELYCDSSNDLCPNSNLEIVLTNPSKEEIETFVKAKSKWVKNLNFYRIKFDSNCNLINSLIAEINKIVMDNDKIIVKIKELEYKDI